MIETISSLALIGSGAYLLAKGYAKDEGIDKIYSSSNPNKNVVSDENARGGNETTGNSMYFGDKDAEYDQFYDYSIDKTFFSEEILDGAKYAKTEHGLAMRCRIVSPFIAEKEPERISFDGKYMAYSKLPYDNVKESTSEYLKKARTFFGGTYRDIAFVLEVFNPYSISASLRQVVFEDIRINGKLCQVFNDFGFCHEASVEQMKILNRYYGEDKMQYHPYILECNITIPKKSSVFVPVALPLTTSTTTLHKFAQAKYLTEDFENKVYFVDKDEKRIHNDLLSEIINNDCSRFYLADCVAPDSLKDANLSMKVLLSSSADNFVSKISTGQEDTKNCSFHNLTLNHSERVGYESNDSYHDSYIGDAQGKVPVVTTSSHHWDVREALADCIFILNDGYPLEEDFPKIENLSYQGFSFKNDFTHENLG